MKYKLKPGFVWNPMLKTPRNAKCPCGSGKKFKKCHMPGMPRALSIDTIEHLLMTTANKVTEK